MAINTVNGQNAFDPSRRIRASLGEEYTENVKAEAIERLSQAMASNGIRKHDEYIEETREEKDMRIRDILKNHTTHTNPQVGTTMSDEKSETPYVEPEEKVSIRKTAFIQSQEKLNNVLYGKKSFVNKAVRVTTGLGTKDSSEQNVRQVINGAFKNLSSLAVNDAMETTFKLGSTKYIGVSAGISSVVDFGSNLLFAGNKVRVDSLFDPNVLTAKEVSNINKTIAKEKVKYAAEHTVAAVVAPSLVKLGIDKIAGSKIKDNKVLSAATSFGVLSEVGKVSLNLIRRANEKKLVKNAANVQYSITSDETVAIKGYNDISKIAINHVINESFDDTLVGSAIGSVIGYKSVVFTTPVNESVTSKAVKAFKEKDSIPTIVDTTVEVKPAAKTSTKKSA